MSAISGAQDLRPKEGEYSDATCICGHIRPAHEAPGRWHEGECGEPGCPCPRFRPYGEEED